MKKYIFILLFLSFCSMGQNGNYWIDSRNPILLLESPIFRNSRVELAVRLNFVNDTSTLTRSDIIINSLSMNFFNRGEIILQREIEPTGSRIESKTYYLNEQIPEHWEYMEYSINYSIKSDKKATQIFKFYNQNANTIANDANEIYIQDDYSFYYSEDFDNIHMSKYIYLKIRAKHDGVILKRDSKLVQSEDGTTPIATLIEDVYINRDKFYIVKMLVGNIISLRQLKRIFFKCKTVINGRIYKDKSVEISLNVLQRYQITTIENNEVIGNAKTKVKVMTNIPGESLWLKFTDNPLIDDNTLINKISGNKSKTDNSFTFDIDALNFKFGNHEIYFEGVDKSHNEQISNTKKYYLTKKENTVKELSILRDSLGFLLSCKLSYPKSDQSDIIIYVNGQKTAFVRNLTEDNKDFKFVINTDNLVKNSIITKDTKSIRISIGLDGIEKETVYVFTVNIIDKSELINKSKKQIKTYLLEKNIAGDTEVIAKRLFEEIGKNEGERRWSNVWQSIVPLIKPVAGVAMMLL